MTNEKSFFKHTISIVYEYNAVTQTSLNIIVTSMY